MSTTLTLADVARLARVQRPVVSMWRRRPLAGLSFPQPTADGRFAAEDVVAYLHQSQRGNNPSAAAELALLQLRQLDASHLDTLAALLTLRGLTDEPLTGLDADQLVDLADELDPDDTHLFHEVCSANPRELVELAEAADALTEAAWHPTRAAELVAARRAQASSGHDQRLTQDLVELLAAISKELLERPAPIVVSGSDGVDVLAAMSHDENYDIPYAVGLGERTDFARLRLHHDWPRQTTLADDWKLIAGSLLVARLAGDTLANLDLLDEMTLQLPEGANALLVAPAGTLTDHLTDTAARQRDAYLRANQVRVAVRLPSGLTRDGSREHLALWVLGNSRVANQPVLVGDLSGEGLTPQRSQLLLDDMVAAIRSPRLRAFHFLSVARPSTLLTAGTLLPRPTRQLEHAPSATDDALRMGELCDHLAAPLPDLAALRPTAVGTGAPATMTVGALIEDGQLRVQSGTRMAALPSGTTRLWTAEAVQQQTPAGVDLLALTAGHPNVRLTQAGDVVFTTAGQPAAVVDHIGGAAVAYPARVLRPVGAAVHPGVLAQAINEQPAGHAKWRLWPVPISQGDDAPIAAALAQLDQWRADLQQRHAQLDELQTLLQRSVLSGAIQLPTPNQPTNNPSTPDQEGH